MTRRDSDVQYVMDALMRLAGEIRPTTDDPKSDGRLFLLGKIVRQLETGEIEGRKPRSSGGRKRSVKARLANGTRISVPADMVEEAK